MLNIHGLWTFTHPSPLVMSISRYTSVYKPYMLLLSNDIDRYVEKFISKERPLREYVREIERMKKMASEIASLPVYVPMHFFMLDCNGINAVKYCNILLILYFRGEL